MELVTALEACDELHVSLRQFRRWRPDPLGYDKTGRAYYDLTSLRLFERSLYRSGKRRLRRVA